MAGLSNENMFYVHIKRCWVQYKQLLPILKQVNIEQ